MSENLKLAVEISIENGKFKAEILNSEALVKRFGLTGADSFNKITDAAGRAPGPVGRFASQVGSLTRGITLMAAGVTAAAAAVGAYLFAMLRGTQIAGEHERQLLRIEAQIRATGGAAGKTAEQLDRQSEAMGRATLFTDDQIRDAQSRLLTFTSITGESFDRAMSAAANLASVMGGDLASAAQLIGKVLEDPADAMTALTRAGIKLNDEQQQIIKNMVEAGDKGKALTTVLEAIEQKIGPTAQEMAAGYAGSVHRLGEAWEDFLESLGQTELIGGAIEKLTYLIDLARQVMSPNESDRHLADLQAVVSLRQQLDIVPANSPDAKVLQSLIAPYEERIAAYRKKLQAEDQASADAAAKASEKRAADEAAAKLKSQELYQAGRRTLDAQATAERRQIEIAAELAILEAKAKAGELGTEKYYARVKQLRLAAVAAEQEAVRAQLAQAKVEDKGDFASAGKILKLEQELTTLALRRKVVMTQTEAEIQQELTSLVREGSEERRRIEIETLRLQGREQEAAQLERQAQYEEHLRRLKLAGVANAEGIARAWLDAGVAADKLREIEALFKERLAKLQDKRVIIELELKAGRIDKSEANRQLTEAETAARTDLEASLDGLLNDPRYQQDPAALQLIRRIRDELRALGEVSNETANRITRAFDQGMTDSMVGIMDGTKSVSDAFEDMGKSVLKTIQRIIAELLTMAAINAVLGVFGYQYGGGQVTALAPKKAADGGYISGPGGDRDDKIPALLSNGEYVIQAPAVRRWGKGFFDQINNPNLMAPPARAIARFATGGYVGASPPVRAPASSTDATGATLSVVNQVDARGVTAEVLPALRRLMRESEQRTTAQILEMLRRGTNP